MNRRNLFKRLLAMLSVPVALKVTEPKAIYKGKAACYWEGTRVPTHDLQTVVYRTVDGIHFYTDQKLEDYHCEIRT